LRIAHIISGTAVGGTENALCRLLSAPAFAKHESAVMSLGSFGPVAESIRAAGIPCDTLDLTRSGFSIKPLKRLRAWLKDMSPDVVVGWMYHGNLAAQLGRLFVSTRVVWNIRQSLQWRQDEKLGTSAVIRLGAWVSRLPHAMVYNSKRAAEQDEAFGYSALRRIVIPNGIDTEAFQADLSARRVIREELRLDSNSVLVGMIARYHPVKAHDVFFEAASLLRVACPKVRFVLAGTGTDKANTQLNDYIRELGLHEVVILLGERKDPQRIMSAMDIAVLASHGEAFPNALCEAMACELACVATRVGDIEIIAGDCGRIVEPGNPSALAQAVRELVGMPEQARKELGKKARRRIQEHYELRMVAERYEAFLASLVAGSPRR
jgi:glycosyltransferase involved in cell wall biosynthesis